MFNLSNIASRAFGVLGSLGLTAMIVMVAYAPIVADTGAVA